jgi:hypothetical protein
MHVQDFQECHFSRKQKTLRGAPLPRNGLVKLKISQFENIQVTLDISLIASKIGQLTPW